MALQSRWSETRRGVRGWINILNTKQEHPQWPSKKAGRKI
jgi:hypothetical protein